MQVQRLSHCPQPLQDGDFNFIYGQGDAVAPHWLVYEVERDYLSQPRRYVVIKILCQDSNAWELDADYPQLEAGVYCLQGSDQIVGNDQHHLVFINHKAAIEWLCSDYSCVGQYYAVTALAALQDHLVNVNEVP